MNLFKLNTLITAIAVTLPSGEVLAEYYYNQNISDGITINTGEIANIYQSTVNNDVKNHSSLPGDAGIDARQGSEVHIAYSTATGIVSNGADIEMTESMIYRANVSSNIYSGIFITSTNSALSDRYSVINCSGCAGAIQLKHAEQSTVVLEGTSIYATDEVDDVTGSYAGHTSGILVNWLSGNNSVTLDSAHISGYSARGESGWYSGVVGIDVENSDNNQIWLTNGSDITVGGDQYAYHMAGIRDGSSATNTTIVIDNSSVYAPGDGHNGKGIILEGTNAILSAQNDSSVSGSRVGIMVGANNNTVNILSGSQVSGDTAILIGPDPKYVIPVSGTVINVDNSTVTGVTNLLDISAGTKAADISFTASSASGTILQESKYDQTVRIDSTAWHGNTAKTDGAGALNLDLSNGSVWTNTAESTADGIALSGNSTIIMNGGNITTGTLESITSTNGSLSAASYAPANIYSTWDANSGAAYVLTAGTASGTFNTGVTSNSSGAAGDMHGDVIVHVDDASAATFNPVESDVGVYRYTSYTVNNADGTTDVVLGGGTIPPDPTPTPDPTPDPIPELSTGSQSVINSRAAAVNLWHDEEEALSLRMDNDRRTGSTFGGQKDNGVWGSYYGGYHRQQMDTASTGFDQTNNGFMLGMDKRVELSNGNLLAGIAFMRGFSDINMHDEGSAGTNADSYGVLLYGSWRLNNGLFMDATLKGEHQKNDMDVISTDGGYAHGHYSTNGYGGSLKAGYHWQNKDMFVEPYVKTSYVHYDGVDYTLSNGLHAKDSNYRSLRMEGGANIGTRLSVHNAEVKPYLHLAVAKETADNNTMRINGVAVDDSTGGSQGIVGLGADVKFTRSLGAYVDANYAKGHDTESPWQVNTGITWSW